MACIEYIEKRFNTKSLKIIEKVNAILAEYALDGMDLTVRQIFYQFVQRDWLQNTMRNYKNLAATIDDARLAGLIDWERIQDRTRFLRLDPTFSSPENGIESLIASYKEDLWLDQECHVEVWIEKDAALGNVERAASQWRCPLFSCRGYTSQSEMWRASQRLYNKVNEDGKRAVIIHLGDHDPSGIDMSRDIQDRLDLFTAPGLVEIHRIALNMNQIKKLKPPPNPAKLTDSRADKYIEQFGRESWELDALPPRYVHKLLSDTIESFVDKTLWEDSVEAEKESIEELTAIRQDWPTALKFVKQKQERERKKKYRKSK